MFWYLEVNIECLKRKGNKSQRSYFVVREYLNIRLHNLNAMEKNTPIS